MTTQPASVSLTLPVGLAIDRVKRLLFQPFDLGKWFVIGFCAWLAHLGEQGSFANFNFGSHHGSGGSVHHQFEHARDYVMSNLHWLVPLVAGVVMVCLMLSLVFLWLRRRNCRGGWVELLSLLSANVGRFVLYVLFQIVLGLAIGMIVLLVIIVTCCCAGCLMAIPYLGTVLLLPVLAFKRSYSLHYLAQYGREYDVFPS